MRGPSSSHSAAPYFIARTCRQLATSGSRVLVTATVRFDPTGSFAANHEAQGSDEGFAAGLLGIEMSDEAYRFALARAVDDLELRFEVVALGRADHPNCVELVLRTSASPGGLEDLLEDPFKAV